MIQLTVLGNLTGDAVVRNTSSEFKAIGFSVAVNEKRKDKEDAATFLNFTYWSKSDKIAQYLTKGKKVLVVCDWVETTEKDGKYYTNYRVRNVNPFLESKAAEQPQSAPKTPASDLMNEDDSDLPF